MATCGLSPQVITESVYALALCAEVPFYPTSLKVITTLEGKERVLSTLSSHGEGWLLRLCQEYDLKPLDICEEDILVPPKNVTKGGSLEDIRTSRDNAMTADTIAQFVKELTEREDVMVHASIAGGRKTMGYLLGYSLSLFGRVHDSLSHVLVSPEYESLEGFYYPSKEPLLLSSKFGTTLDASAAQIDLAILPFVRLRSFLPNHLLNGKVSFSETVNAILLGPNLRDIRVEVRTSRVIIDESSIVLTPIQVVVLSYLIERAKAGEGLQFPRKNIYDTELGNELLAEAKRLGVDLSLRQDTRNRLARGVDSSYLYTLFSRLRKSIANVVGIDIARVLLKETKSGVGEKSVEFGADLNAVTFSSQCD